MSAPVAQLPPKIKMTGVHISTQRVSDIRLPLICAKLYTTKSHKYPLHSPG